MSIDVYVHFFSFELFFFIDIYLIYNIVLVSDIQHSDSDIYIEREIFFFRFLSLIAYYKILSIVSYAILQVLVSYLLNM